MDAKTLYRFKKSLDNKFREGKSIEGLFNKYPRKFPMKMSSD